MARFLFLLIKTLILLLVVNTSYAAKPKLIIQGATGEAKDNLEAWLDDLGENCNLTTRAQRALLKSSNEQAKQALEALGYYHSDIKLSIETTKDCWNLLAEVELNKPLVITQLNIQLTGEAQQDKVFQKYLAKQPLQEGTQLKHNLYEELRNKLSSLARERGYFDAKLTQKELLIDLTTDEVQINLTLESGKRYKFGEVRFLHRDLDTKFLEKFIHFKAGDYYDLEEVLKLRLALSRSGYFKDVRITSLHQEADKLEVPLELSYKMAERYVYTAGIGVSTDTGPRLKMGLQDRHFNEKGHRYTTGFEVSPIRSNVGFNYEIPLADPSRERINLGANFTHEDIDDKTSDLLRFRVAYLKELTSGWIATPFVDWEREKFTLADQTDTTFLLMPGLEMTRTKANHALYPTKGWKLNAMVRGAQENLGSSVSFVQFKGQAKLVIPSWYGRFLTRVDFATTWADAVTDLPNSVRFFAGGDTSLRGYRYKSLGPTNSAGEVIGGRHLLTASLEYEFPLVGKWYGAVFSDMGNAFDDFQKFENYQGTGAGIRWRSPIGPIRFDVAHPNKGKDNFRIHLSMGVDL